MWLTTHQNDLLSDRVAAICLSVGGGFLAGLTTSLIQNGADDIFTTTLFITSTLAGVAGGVWMIVNELQLISNQKKINNALTLRYGPDGIALQF